MDLPGATSISFQETVAQSLPSLSRVALASELMQRFLGSTPVALHRMASHGQQNLQIQPQISKIQIQFNSKAGPGPAGDAGDHGLRRFVGVRPPKVDARLFGLGGLQIRAEEGRRPRGNAVRENNRKRCFCRTT